MADDTTKPDHGFTTDEDRQLAADQAREHLAAQAELLGERHDAEIAALRARVRQLEAERVGLERAMDELAAERDGLRSELSLSDRVKTRALERVHQLDEQADVDGAQIERLRAGLAAADIANGKLTRANTRLHARCLRLLKERKGGVRRKPAKRAKAKR